MSIVDPKTTKPEYYDFLYNLALQLPMNDGSGLTPAEFFHLSYNDYEADEFPELPTRRY
jgi:hypothetical protein